MKVTLQLMVADLLATEAFYAGILEAPLERAVTPRGAPEHLILDQGGVEILFVSEDAAIRQHPALEDSLASFPKGIGMTLHFQVENIEDIYDALLEEELEILYPLERKPFGVKDLWCLDPDGYLVVLEERE